MRKSLSLDGGAAVVHAIPGFLGPQKYASGVFCLCRPDSVTMAVVRSAIVVVSDFDAVPHGGFTLWNQT